MESARRVVHTITPGDHYSPLTGSAIATVVHGLASAAKRAGDDSHRVVIARSTYQTRYDSAAIVEYELAPGPGPVEHRMDILGGWLGVPRRATARYFAPIAEVLHTLEPSVVLAHNAPILPWLLRDSPHKVVLYAHNQLLRTYSTAEAGRVLQSAAAIVCVSESLAEATRARLPLRLVPRVHVIGNGVDTNTFVPRTQASAAGLPITVLFVGRMIPEKGADVLVDAAALVNRPQVEFVFVGSRGFDSSEPLSPYEQELRISASRVRSPVRFLPFTDRASLPELLATADILVVPSRWPDPSPLTIGEGMSSALAVIGSRAGGIPEVLGPAGILVPPGDAPALARQLVALIDDAPKRHSLGAVARARALERDWTWSWRNMQELLSTI